MDDYVGIKYEINIFPKRVLFYILKNPTFYEIKSCLWWQQLSSKYYMMQNIAFFSLIKKKNDK